MVRTAREIEARSVRACCKLVDSSTIPGVEFEENSCLRCMVGIPAGVSKSMSMVKVHVFKVVVLLEVVTACDRDRDFVTRAACDFTGQCVSSANTI